ncbi:YncE family protein [Lutibacter sp.]|uniref:YncE family protein n=1 Tax=Lutibacter sp. TaxID=1925666 RepID=UPI003566F0F1
MKISKFLLSIFLLSVIFVSCTNDDDDVQEPKGAYENGILISGEGGPSGSIYYVSNDFSTTESLIYKKVNNNDLGVYLQSMAFDNENAYIVVDNQNTITVVDRYTFEKKGVITTNIIAPRYMVVVGDKGYATNWGSTSDNADDFVAVIDLNTFEVTKTISVGNGPERIVANNGKLYVSHKGAYTTNNIITVIDIASETTTEITVKDNPDELFFDNAGNLVVLCEGLTLSYNPDWTANEKTPVSITKISTVSNNIISELIFENGQFPSLLTFDGSYFYYNLGSKIYKVASDASTLPTTEFLDAAATNLYGIEVNDSYLFLLDASFTAQSKLDVYSSNTKEKINSFAAPIGASKVYFN